MKRFVVMTANRGNGFRTMLDNHYKIGIVAPLSRDEFIYQSLDSYLYENWCNDCKELLFALDDYYAELRNNTSNESFFMPHNVYVAYKKVLSYLKLGESETKLKVGENDLKVLMTKCVTNDFRKEYTGVRVFRRELEKFLYDRLNDEKIMTRTEYELLKTTLKNKKDRDNCLIIFA